jgi:predicted lipoprotein with Yx(FWY)xxD motif
VLVHIVSERKEFIMRRFTRLSSLLLLVTLLALGVAGTRLVTQAQGAPALVKTAAGAILVTASGKTLYVFALDKKGTSACTGKCAAFWPPLVVPTGSKVPAAMPGVSGKFGEIMRKDGTDQLTYDGAPLYTFAKDTKPGQMNGQGVGGIWWAVACPAM